MINTATKAQTNYLEILFNDRGYNREERSLYLSDHFNRQIKFLDELTIKEASEIITILKES